MEITDQREDPVDRIAAAIAELDDEQLDQLFEKLKILEVLGEVPHGCYSPC